MIVKGLWLEAGGLRLAILSLPGCHEDGPTLYQGWLPPGTRRVLGADRRSAGCHEGNQELSLGRQRGFLPK